MNLFGMLELSGSALGAERQRAEVVAATWPTPKPRAPRRVGRIAASWWYFKRSVFPASRSRSPAGNAKALRRCAWRRWFRISGRR